MLATSAEEALAQAASGRPSMALLDYHLGVGMDGLDLASELRRQRPDLGIALITADKSVMDDLRAKELTVLFKPIDPERLWAFLGQTAAAAA